VTCHREPRRISCLLVDSSKMDKILIKQSRNRKSPKDIFLIALQFKEDFKTIKSDFGDQFDKLLKERITDFANVKEVPEGLLPHRGTLDHKEKLTCYQPRQRRNRLFMPEHDELKWQCTELFQQGKFGFRTAPMRLLL